MPLHILFPLSSVAVFHFKLYCKELFANSKLQFFQTMTDFADLIVKILGLADSFC